MKKIRYPDAEMLAMDLASQLSDDLAEQLRQKPRVSFAVPGGGTPGPVFDILCAADLDWQRVNVVLTDERWVDETSPRSNTRLLRQRLLVDRAAAAHFVPLYGAAERPEDLLPELSLALIPHLPIDVLLLGMGEDMHTASLFPGADRLSEAFARDAPILLPVRAKGAGEPRVTLTAPVLHSAISTHIVFTGKAKNKALKRARKINDPLLAPISAFLKGATVHWAP